MIALLSAFLFFCNPAHASEGECPSACLAKDTIFDGDVRGPYYKMLFKTPQSTTGSGTATVTIPKNVALTDAYNSFSLNQYFAQSIGIGTESPQWKLHIVANSATASGPLGIYNASGTLLASIDNSGNSYSLLRSSAASFALTNPGYTAKSRRMMQGLLDISAFNADNALTGGAWVVDDTSRVGTLAVMRADDWAISGHTLFQLIQVSTPTAPATTSDLFTFDMNNGSLFIGRNLYTGAGKLVVDGNIATTAGRSYYIGSSDINTAGTLSNVAYQNQTNTFALQQKIGSSAYATIAADEPDLKIHNTNPSIILQRNTATAYADWRIKNNNGTFQFSAGYDGTTPNAFRAPSMSIEPLGAVTIASSVTVQNVMSATQYYGSGSTLSSVRLSTVAITSADVDSSVLIATSPAGGDATGTLSSLSVIDNSHNHSQISITGFTTSTGTTLEIAAATTTVPAMMYASSGTWSAEQKLSSAAVSNLCLSGECKTAWPASGGGNANTTTGVAGELAYYTTVSTISPAGIKPSQVLTSTSTRVAFRDIDNSFSAPQTLLSSGTVLTTNDRAAVFEAINSTNSQMGLLSAVDIGFTPAGADSRVGLAGSGIGTSGSPADQRNGIGVFGAAQTGRVRGFGVVGVSTGTGTALGTYGTAVGTGVNYGIYGSANGAATRNYGVYGTASGGTDNYAGYFSGQMFVNGLARISGATTQAVFKMDTASNDNGIWIASQIGNTHYNWKVSAQDDFDGDFQITPSTGIGSTSWSGTSWSLRYDGTHLKQYTPVSNYNGNEYLVNLELLAVSPVCVAAAGGAYTNIIKTSGTQTCNTACGTTAYTTCTDVVLFNDIGNVNQLRLKNNWGCATSDSYIKYCCCK